MAKVSLIVWERIKTQGIYEPCERSLHSSALWKEYLIIFGGYDGQHRVNDLLTYNFATSVWKVEQGGLGCPSPRDRHVSVISGDVMYIFGGFDGTKRVNDLYAYHLKQKIWREINQLGCFPSSRHSHAACAHNNSLFMFGGYDGTYRNDLYRFDFALCQWSQVLAWGEAPRPRYRCSCVVHDDNIIVHGGHDGTTHLHDTFVFCIGSSSWSHVGVNNEIMPCPRDSHIAVVYDNTMFIYGGSDGNAINDVFALDLETNSWREVLTSFISHSSGHNVHQELASDAQAHHYYDNHNLAQEHSPHLYPPPPHSPSHSLSPSFRRESGSPSNHLLDLEASFSEALTSAPPPRFCHSGVCYEGRMIVFGGYDGTSRLNDFICCKLFDDSVAHSLKSRQVAPSLVSDLSSFVNCELLSDITFVVENRPIRAHKILCVRHEYFRRMLTGEYMEGSSREVVMGDIAYDTFLQVLEYLYTDQCSSINLVSALPLLQAANRMGLQRLSHLAEQVLSNNIDCSNAATVLLMAEIYGASSLKQRSLQFVLRNFDKVSRTLAFEELGRSDVELLLEILKLR